MRLTDISIRSLTPPERDQKMYPDENLPGFGVRVSQGGTKTFVLVHEINRRRETIGRYPTLTLQARPCRGPSAARRVHTRQGELAAGEL